MHSVETIHALKESLELLPSPILLASSDSSEIWMNAAFMRFIDCEPSKSIESPDRIITREQRPFTVYQDGRRVPPERLPSALSSAGETVTAMPLQMHLRSGRTIDVLVFAGPIRDASGAVSGGIVTCFDVSAQERRGFERVRFLADAGAALGDAMSVDAVISTMQHLIVPRLATYCSIMLLGEGGLPTNMFMHHLDPQLLRVANRLRMQYEIEPPMFELAARVARSGQPLIIPDIGELLKREHFSDAYRAFMRDLSNTLGIYAAVYVPMQLRGVSIGSILVADRRHRHFSNGDLSLLEDLARRGAAALESARSLERHEESSTTLQRALLPARLPNLEDVTFDAVYAPGGDQALVGGDWYDAFELTDGRIMVTMGDVTGRGLHAAVLMSKVRQSLSALSYYETDPVKLLDVAQRTLQRRHPDAIVTSLVGVLDVRDMTFTYATAGHPMPYLRRAGAIVALPGHGLPIGLRGDDEASPVTVKFEHDDVLLLYTDGLIESTHDIVQGEARVRDALRSAEGQLAHYVERVVLPDGSPDDVALLTLRISDGRGAGAQQTLGFEFDARDVRMARESRICITAFLRELGAPPERLHNAELVFGELISNVVRHAPGKVYVGIDWSDDYPELRVTDRGTGYSKHPRLPKDPLSESGRGLFIVEALTRRFEVGRAPHGGSDVRALLDIPRATAALR